MKTPMHGLAERLQSEVDCLLDIIEARNATIAGLQGQLHEAHALTAEWRAHDASIDRLDSFAEACRRIAHGFDGVSR